MARVLVPLEKKQEGDTAGVVEETMVTTQISTKSDESKKKKKKKDRKKGTPKGGENKFEKSAEVDTQATEEVDDEEAQKPKMKKKDKKRKRDSEASDAAKEVIEEEGAKSQECDEEEIGEVTKKSSIGEATKKSSKKDVPVGVEGVREMKKKSKDKKRKRDEESADAELDATMKEEYNEGTKEPAASECAEAAGFDEADAKDEKAGDDKKSRRAARRAERERLLKELPKIDENGVSYTKQQLRRMRKRLARGLDPVETEAEKQERLRNELQLRREEEAEMAGLIYEKPNKNVEDEDEDDVDEGGEGGDDDDAGSDDDGDGDEGGNESPEALPPKKKKQRTKPVPDDYVCNICKNEHKPLHWIYDCPSGCVNSGTTKHKGLVDPDDRKVFVSGLPFEATRKDVLQMFKQCGNVKRVKLVTFEDSGRCKGQAYLTFTSKEEAMKAIRLNGTTINKPETPDSKKKVKQNQRKVLKLSVRKVLNREITKKGGHKKFQSSR